jgi:hypothetical protein
MTPEEAETSQHFETVMLRFGETWEAAVVHRLLNEKAHRDADEELNKVINRRGGFWTTANLSFQAATLSGFFALLDHDGNSATFYSVLARAKAARPDAIFDDFKLKLDTIRERYKRYRHKLFGHNDKKRASVADEFNAAGFSHASVEDDLRTLDYILKVCRTAALSPGEALPAPNDTVRWRFPYNDSVERARAHTVALFEDLRG